MNLDEHYLEFLAADDVRIRGTRVGLEHLLAAYSDGALPEEVCLEYPTLSLEQVYGVIAWYLRNRREADEYLAARRADSSRARNRARETAAAEVVQRLRRMTEARIAK